MPVYLSRYIGTGTVEDEFRPEGAEGVVGWWSIDLRPDRTTAAGWCILRTSSPVPVSQRVIQLPDPDGNLSSQQRNTIANRLGVTLDPAQSVTLRQLLRHLLVDLGDGTRWKPLRACRRVLQDGRRALAYEIRLGELVHDEIIAADGPGTTLTDDFNRADSSSMGGSWTEVTGNTNIVSNKAEAQTNNTNHALRWEADLATDDHYSEADITFVGAASQASGTCVRFASAATTYYTGKANPNADLDIIQKCEAGTFTTLASQAHTLGATTLLIRTEANGSTIAVDVPGTAQLSVTDTSITGNLRAGIDLRRGANASAGAQADNWQAGDLATDATAAPSVIARSFTIPAATAQANVSRTPDPTATVVSVPAATVVANATVTPAVIACTVSVPQASPQAAATAEPAVIATAAALPQALGAAITFAQPEPIAATVALPAATAQASSTATPAAIPTTATLPAASLSAEAVVAQTTIPTAVSLPAAEAQAHVSRTPDTLLTVAALPQASPAADWTASPTVIATVVAVPAATTSTATTATPATIPTTVALPQATPDTPGAGTTVEPATIATTATVPQAALTAGADATPATIQLAATILAAVGAANANPAPAVIALAVVMPGAAAYWARNATSTPTVAPKATSSLTDSPHASSVATVTKAATSTLTDNPKATSTATVTKAATSSPTDSDG